MEWQPTQYVGPQDPPVRYVFSIDPHGMLLYSRLRQLLPSVSTEDINFVFQELMSGLFSNVFNENPEVFELNLVMYPDFRMFAHIPEMQDVELQKQVREYASEVAWRIFFTIRDFIFKTNISAHRDYLLESATLNYIVVCVYHFPRH